MAITLVQRKKIQQGLALVVLVVLFITVTVLWLGFFRKTPVVMESGDITAPPPKSVEIRFEVLEHPLLQALDNPADPVLEPLVKGRSNPFLPF